MRNMLAIILTLGLALPALAADIAVSWTKNTEPEVTGYYVQQGALSGSAIVWGEMRDATTWDEEAWTDAQNNTRTDCGWVWTSAPDTGYTAYRVAAHDNAGNTAWNMEQMVIYCGDCIAPPAPSGLGW